MSTPSPSTSVREKELQEQVAERDRRLWTVELELARVKRDLQTAHLINASLTRAIGEVVTASSGSSLEGSIVSGSISVSTSRASSPSPSPSLMSLSQMVLSGTSASGVMTTTMTPAQATTPALTTTTPSPSGMATAGRPSTRPPSPDIQLLTTHQLISSPSAVDPLMSADDALLERTMRPPRRQPSPGRHQASSAPRGRRDDRRGTADRSRSPDVRRSEALLHQTAAALSGRPSAAASGQRTVTATVTADEVYQCIACGDMTAMSNASRHFYAVHDTEKTYKGKKYLALPGMAVSLPRDALALLPPREVWQNWRRISRSWLQVAFDRQDETAPAPSPSSGRRRRQRFDDEEDDM